MKSERLLLGLLAMGATPEVFAYVDPGSGMLMWQGLVAAVGAVLVFARNPWQAIKRFLARFRKEK